MRSINILLVSALAVVLCHSIAPAQELTAEITNVDFSALPRVSFKACVERDGEILRGLDASNMTLLENGVPRQLSVRCPDPTEKNYVVLVLDNSGSIFAALSKLIEASKQLVDGLGPDDEAAIITFGRDVNVAQEFTDDKDRLKLVLDGMVASGGTPLFDASYLACEMLRDKQGNKHAVIITDGEDNTSSYTDDDVIQVANSLGVTLHTVAFDIAPKYRDLMERMAVLTGGAHFFVSRPSDLPAVYQTIADIITEPCCIIEYESEDCVETLRSLLLTVSHAGETAIDEKLTVSPSRPEQTVIALDVPEEITPLATGRAFIEILPAPTTELALTLSFILEYDENLVEIPLLPFTLGTVTQNQFVAMERVAPGAMRFRLEQIAPAMQTTRLVGFSIRALVADSSRKVGFSIRDIEIAGCPTTFIPVTDSTLICQCFRALNIELDSVLVIDGPDEILIPLLVQDGLEEQLPTNSIVEIHIPEGLELLGVEDGSLFEAGMVQWMTDGNALILLTSSAIPVDVYGSYALLRLRGAPSPKVQRYELRVAYTELWQRCCPSQGELPVLSIVQDGLCEFLVRRIDPEIEMSLSPNPMEPHSFVAAVNIHVRTGIEPGTGTLDLMDMQGRALKRLPLRELREGDTRIVFSTGDLPAGRYTLRLITERGVVVSPLMILR